MYYAPAERKPKDANERVRREKETNDFSNKIRRLKNEEKKKWWTKHKFEEKWKKNMISSRRYDQSGSAIQR